MMSRKRTNQESQAFKARIADLKGEGRTCAEIARELGVTRQYVSLVLIQAGLTERRRRKVQDEPENDTSQVTDTIGRLKQQKQRELAEKLRKLLARRLEEKKTAR